MEACYYPGVIASFGLGTGVIGGSVGKGTEAGVMKLIGGVYV